MSSHSSTSSTPSAIHSLIFSTSSIATASTFGQVIARQSNKKNKKKPVPRPHPSFPILSRPPLSRRASESNNDTTATKKSANNKNNNKSPFKPFKIFRSKSKRSSKISSAGYNLPSTTPCDNLALDDDMSSTYSEVTSVLIGTRSVPNLPSLNIPSHSDNSPALSLTGFKQHCLQAETLHEEDEDAMVNGPRQKQRIEMEIVSNDESDEELDWDGKLVVPTQNSVRRSSLPAPNQTATAAQNKRHHRTMSLPQASIQDLPKSLYHRQPTPSEIWDDDFDLVNMREVPVPTRVEETQLSIRMDLSNIRDFTTQIEVLKTLRNKKGELASHVQSQVANTKKKWKHGLIRNDEIKTLKKLEEAFKADWEEANVIIDISEIAQDQTPTFNGGKSVELGIEQVPSERHLTILRKIIDEQLGNSVSISGNDNINHPKSLFQIDFGGNNAGISNNNESTINNDENKENQMMDIIATTSTFSHEQTSQISIDTTNTAATSSKKAKTGFNAWNGFYGLKRNNSGQVIGHASKKKRRDNVRISVDEMPSLIEHLHKLQERLSKHVDQLSQLSA
ncbi:8793_t:CDS:2 [Ambispora leptoticha]|uniref:8793_t:CDS:1 n=1 Tax=Ambispora leptoticha TaxID=144679 RepID=A0A9N8VG67_9GLOM|nr:8793_t:CDS:2 [Ambispora leptoticha]